MTEAPKAPEPEAPKAPEPSSDPTTTIGDELAESTKDEGK